MQKVKRDFGTICSEEEERILSPLQGGRQRLLAPVTNVLIHLGITADMVSFASVGFACGFCLLAAHLFVAAFWLLVAAFICDGLDGVVARQTKTNTARGSFTDMFCDQSVVALSVAGLTWIGAIHPLLAILYVFMYAVSGFFLTMHFLLQVSARWFIRPGKTLFCIIIVVDFFLHINLLNYLLLAYLLTLPLLGLSFWRLRRAL
jgi:phosphatidylglycerophosphate synthase